MSRASPLSKLDLRLDPDERVALIGANGNGKTTLARLLAGRLAPFAGEVTRSPKLAWTAGCPDMRQNPVGEPAATAALNFGTPRRRSSLKRLRPFCHCRQRYERNLRRIHASRFVSTRGVWQKPK